MRRLPVHLQVKAAVTACGRGVEQQDDLWTRVKSEVTCPRCLTYNEKKG